MNLSLQFHLVGIRFDLSLRTPMSEEPWVSSSGKESELEDGWRRWHQGLGEMGWNVVEWIRMQGWGILQTSSQDRKRKSQPKDVLTLPLVDKRLPSLIQFPAVDEDVLDQSFSQVIGFLEISSYLLKDHFSIWISWRLYMAPEEVPFDCVVTSTACDVLVGGQSESTTVVFICISLKILCTLLQILGELDESYHFH